MGSLFKFRLFGNKSADSDHQPADTPALVLEFPSNLDTHEETALLRTAAWISAGLGALALGLFVGRELRQRYKFNRRTPYDFYAHSGDPTDLEFGVGI